MRFDVDGYNDELGVGIPLDKILGLDEKSFTGNFEGCVLLNGTVGDKVGATKFAPDGLVLNEAVGAPEENKAGVVVTVLG